MAYPVFASGDVLNASDMNAVGLWLVKTQTVGSGVTSVAVSSAFSSSYDSYLVTYSGGAASTNPVLTFKLGASATGYYNSMPYVSYAGTTAQAVYAANAANFNWAGYCGPNYTGIHAIVSDPFLSKYTRISAFYQAENEAGTMGGIHKVASSYTDFTIGVSAGTLTGGTIRVYGLRN